MTSDTVPATVYTKVELFYLYRGDGCSGAETREGFLQYLACIKRYKPRARVEGEFPSPTTPVDQE